MYTMRYRIPGTNVWRLMKLSGDFNLFRDDSGTGAENWGPRKKGDELKCEHGGPHTVYLDDHGLVAVTSVGEPTLPEPEDA
jgi:hypothetical protein